METYRIAVIPGDGIGPEVIREGIRVLESIAENDGGFRFEFHEFPWGCDYYLEHGEMMPPDALEQLACFDAIFLGAVGRPDVPDHISLNGLLLAIRKGFDQYVNLRPVALLDGAPCPIAGIDRASVNMTFVRENSEGEYAGTGSHRFARTPQETVIQESVFTRKGCERIMRYAFALARREGKSLTSVSKGNALNYSMVFWDSIFAQIAKEYPDVPTHTLLVDAAAMFMVKEPKRFEIVVTSNLFGDILTDLGAAIAGGMGLAAGANLNPERRYPSMFEPIHGSAPDIAGKGLANPLATIWAASQMLDFFGKNEWGKRVLSAMTSVLVEGNVLTSDLGGTATTSQVGNAVIDALCMER